MSIVASMIRLTQNIKDGGLKSGWLRDHGTLPLFPSFAWLLTNFSSLAVIFGIRRCNLYKGSLFRTEVETLDRERMYWQIKATISWDLIVQIKHFTLDPKLLVFDNFSGLQKNVIVKLRQGLVVFIFVWIFKDHQFLVWGRTFVSVDIYVVVRWRVTRNISWDSGGACQSKSWHSCLRGNPPRIIEIRVLLWENIEVDYIFPRNIF